MISFEVWFKNKIKMFKLSWFGKFFIYDNKLRLINMVIELIEINF